jgi:hypothetical protein
MTNTIQNFNILLEKYQFVPANRIRIGENAAYLMN